MRRARRAHKAVEGQGTRKERKSFTLSQESIALLNELCAARQDSQRRSASAVLDDLLRSLRKERRRQGVERSVARYYSGLSDEEQVEDFEWGEFALAQFPDEEA